MTYGDIINAARVELKDIYSGSYTYSDDEMCGYVKEALDTAASVRPSAFYAAGFFRPEGNLPENINKSFLSVSFYIDPLYFRAIVAYVIYAALSRDVADEGNAAAAAAWLGKFNQKIAG